ncbi:YycH family regulatory protein [Priestia taiwanensis]|uniref:Regulatory protein YycH domain-containing protein n=1 Tax=Priestia taiwanensis TaxID=1347902 RepID=A0A917ESC8_9BACI|nr:two-component system activity regulator YycH [Priestia taiwanensis]MBM7364868.1 regulatory protein YycH of two-component signal transduction system YycFG [Priestia taiwanensis]GGE83044.1 hypothetical protein GCM10007140_35750 [Priestia taiwanensis]
MNLEKFKSILLTNLVIISIFLTWNLWTYQTDLEKATEDISKVKETDMKKEADVIQPHQVAYHINGKHYVSDKRENIDSVNQLLMNGEFEEVKDISNDLGKTPFNSYINGSDKIELVFSAEIPMEIVGKIYDIKSSKETNIDRIVIDSVRNSGEAYKVYFISYNEKKILRAMFSSELENTFKYVQDYFPSNVDEHIEYELHGEDKKMVYLPVKERKLDKYYVNLEPVHVNRFAGALFQGRPYKKLNGKDSTTFTDGTQILQVDKENRSFFFLDNTIINGPKLAGSALLHKSIEFTSVHEGWLDEGYFFDEWNPDIGETTFRLFIEKSIPLFTSTTITQQFSKDDIILYKSPLYTLSKNPGHEETLPSGETFIKSLKNNPEVDFESVQDIRIGYEMTQKEAVNIDVDGTTVLELKPCWVFKYPAKNNPTKMVYYKLGEGGKLDGLE